MMPTSDATVLSKTPAADSACASDAAKGFLSLRDLLRMNLSIEMRRQRLTQDALAIKAGVRHATISNMLAGRHAATIDSVEKVSRALGKNAAGMFIKPPDGVYEASLASS